MAKWIRVIVNYSQQVIDYEGEWNGKKLAVWSTIPDLVDQEGGSQVSVLVI